MDSEYSTDIKSVVLAVLDAVLVYIAICWWRLAPDSFAGSQRWGLFAGVILGNLAFWYLWECLPRERQSRVLSKAVILMVVVVSSAALLTIRQTAGDTWMKPTIAVELLLISAGALAYYGWRPGRGWFCPK